MSGTEQTERKQTIPVAIEIERRVKGEADWLLSHIEEIKPQLDEILGQYRSGFGKSQIHNLLRAVKTAAGIGEVKLFIQYQMGRDTQKNGWFHSYSADRMTFGDRINRVLDAIQAKSQELSVGWQPEDQVSLSLKLMERFFVYMHWHYTYVEKSKKSDASNNRGPRRDEGRRPNQGSQGYRGGNRR